MSDIFGPSRPRPEPSAGGVDRRRRVLVPTLITLAVLLFVGSIFTSVWTDRLWFDSVDYPDVFRTVLFTRVGLFLVLGLAFGLFVVGNIYVAWRFRPDAVPMRRDDPAFEAGFRVGPDRLLARRQIARAAALGLQHQPRQGEPEGRAQSAEHAGSRAGLGVLDA